MALRRGARTLAAPAVCLALLGCGAGETRLQGVIVIVLDTLRADRLSSYGHGRPTSPELDALADQGVLFERVASDASWTLPSLVAILSGRHPSTAVYERQLRLSLVDRIRADGWRTAAFTEGGFASRRFGLDRGFDSWWEGLGSMRIVALRGGIAAGPRGSPEEVAEQKRAGAGIETTFGRVERWLRAHAGERFFLLVQTYEVHSPYVRDEFAAELEPAGEGSEADLARLRALYDGGIRVADEQVGRLRRLLAELGLAGVTLLAVTSDHGEDLGDREPAQPGSHGHSVHQELISVPLILYDPQRSYPVERVSSQVRAIDLLPTLLERMGIAPEPGSDGRSLLPLMRGEEGAPRPVFAGTHNRRAGQQGQVAFIEYPYKLVVDESAGAAAHKRLYDLDADPMERRDLAHLRPELVDRLWTALAQERERLPPPADFDDLPPATLDARRRLEALGYLR